MSHHFRGRSALRAAVLFLAAGLALGAVGCGGDTTKDKRDASKKDAVAWRAERERALAPEPGMPADKKDADERHNTEQYGHIVDNDFLSPAQTPLSTLSIDVDTASYSNVRSFLEQGRLPPRDAVRIEELVNYFPYAYPAPVDGRPVSLTADLAVCPWNDRHRLVRVGLRGRSVDPQQLPRRNFVFLVDTSGSMSQPNRLPLLQASLRLLAEGLTAQDRVALVAYAGSAGLVLPSTRGDDRRTILAAVDRLRAGGSTNGGQGIELAYRIAEENFIAGGLNRVVLGTDGDFNVGVTSEGELVRLIERKRKSGVFLTVLGFGRGNLKDRTMEQLAHHGNGSYAYIDTLAEARKLFVEQGAALVTIARDVKLQVEFNPGRVAAYRLLGYENRLLRDQDFNDDGKDAGDMGSGHTVTALFEVVPAGQSVNVPGVDPLKYQSKGGATPEAGGGEWLTVKMRYKDVDAETSQVVSRALSGEAVPVSAAGDDFRFAAAVTAFGLSLRDSKYRGKATLELAAELARGALGRDPGGHRAAFVELVEKARHLSRRQ